MADKKESTVFEILSQVDVSEHVEKKGDLDYLSWSWAWTYLKKLFGNEFRIEYEKFDEYDHQAHQLTGRKVNYCETSTGTYVTCTITIQGHSETETLPVRSFKNKAIIYPDQMEIDKTRKRCFVKACALQGLGLNVYVGEDLPVGFEQMTTKQEGVITDYCQNISKINGKGKGALYKEAILKCKIRDYKNMSKQDADNVIEYLANKLKDVAEQQKEQEKVANTNE